MARFAYKARTRAGEVVSGREQAADRRELRTRLSRSDLDLIQAQELSERGTRDAEEARRAPGGLLDRLFPPVRASQIRALTSQLALMLETGTPLSESLHALAEQADNERLAEVLAEVHQSLSGGYALSDALSLHPRVFGTFYVSAVKAGESSGNLTGVFQRIEADMAKREEMVSRLRAALTYPIILSVLATGAIIFLVSYVLPKFSAIFEASGARLPLPTRILITTTDLAQHYWYAWLLLLAALVAGVWYFLRGGGGKATLDRLVLALPLVGGLTRTVQAAVLLRTLSTLLGSGVSLVESLEVARGAVSHTRFKEVVSDILSGVLRGESFSGTFAKSDLFTPAVKQMVATGEKTGRMALVMGKMSDHLDNAAQKSVQKLSAIFEPLVIILMGVVIGFIAISLMLPLFRMSAVMKHGG
jgi:type II secretory pathway component PulF